jgi:hypothetical protein
VRSNLTFGAAIEPIDRFSDDTSLSIFVVDEIDRELKRRQTPLLRNHPA